MSKMSIYDRIKNKLGPNGLRGFIKTRIKALIRKMCSSFEEDNSIIHDQFEKNKGILFIAFGEKYVKEAIFCVKSLKNYTQLPCTIYCDMMTDENKKYFDEVNLIIPDHVRTKVDYLEKTPYEKTLYLDSDTMITEDIEPIFDLLNKYDVAMTHDFARKRFKWSQVIDEYNAIPDAFSEFGGGVILYKKSTSFDFLKKWKHYFYKYYDKTNGWDQASLRIASWKTENLIYVLPPEYNIRGKNIRLKTDKLPEVEGGKHPLRSRILHWHGLDDPNCTIEPYQI